jgi:hypothetical protein
MNRSEVWNDEEKSGNDKYDVKLRCEGVGEE